MWKRFTECSYISGREAEILGGILKIDAEKILNWFHLKRNKIKLQDIQRARKCELSDNIYKYTSPLL